MRGKQIIRTHWFPVLILFLTALYFSFSTRFFLFADGSYGHDAGIFAYIGMAMKNGRVLYTEAWENKGPLLYFINLLGITLHYRYGIYLLELITLFITNLFLYKTALLFFDRWISLLATVFSLLPLSVSLEGGNLSEEYALAFLSIGLYFIAKFFRQDCVLKKYEMILVGMTVSAILLLRANILAFTGVLVLTVIVVLIRQKRFTRLLQVFAFALLGFVLFTLPFLVYLVKNHALNACLQTAYFGTLSDFEPLAKATWIKNVVGMVEAFINSGAFYIVVCFLLAFAVSLLRKSEGPKELNPLLWACVFALFVNLAANSLSGAYQMHYFMTFIPILLIPSAWIFDMVRTLMKKLVSDKTLATAITCALVCFISLHSVPQLSHMVINNLRNDKTPLEQYNLIASYIEKNALPEDTVQLFGGGPAATANYRTGRLSASRYNYYANGRFSDEAKTEFANGIAADIQVEPPRLIIVQSLEKYNDFLAHIDDSSAYLELIETEYEQDITDAGPTKCIIYKRKS